MFPWYVIFLKRFLVFPTSLVFIFFFALFTLEGFLISPCYSLKLCIQDRYIFPFLLCLSLLFLAICKASSDILPFAFLFLGDGFDHFLLYSILTSVLSSLGTGEGNGKPLQHSCLENPMNSMKQQTNMHGHFLLPTERVVP